MSPQHEHRLPTLLIQLLKQEEGLLLEAKAALLVAVHNVESVVAPIVGDVVAFESLKSTQDG